MALDAMSPIFSEQLKKRIGDAHMEMTSLAVGIQLEMNAIRHYKTQSEVAKDAGIKKLFAQLADWERGHYNALLTQQDELKEQYWSDSGFSPF